MTTHNHTAFALTVGLITQDASPVLKFVALSALAVGHITCDLLPHQHYYSFDNIKKNLFGVIFELGFGLVLLPVIIAVILRLQPPSVIYLFACLFTASVLDFLTALKIKSIERFHLAIHFWQNKMTPFWKWVFEASESIVLFWALIIIVIDRSG